MIKKYLSYFLTCVVCTLYAQQKLVEKIEFPNPDAEITKFLKDNSIYGEPIFKGPLKHIHIHVKHMDDSSLTSESKIKMFFDSKSKLQKTINQEILYTGIEPCLCGDEEDESIVKFTDTIFHDTRTVKSIKNTKPLSVDSLTGALELKKNFWYKDDLLIQKIDADDVKTVYVYDDNKRLTEEHVYVRDILENGDVTTDENTEYLVTEFYKNYMAKAIYNDKGQIAEIQSYSHFQEEFYFSHIIYSYNEDNQLTDYKKTTRDYYNVVINDDEDLDKQSWFESINYMPGSVTQNWIYKGDKLMKSVYKSSSDESIYTQDYIYNKDSIVIDEFNTSFSLMENKTEEYKSKSIYKYDTYNNLISYKSVNISEGKEIIETDAVLKITYQ